MSDDQSATPVPYPVIDPVTDQTDPSAQTAGGSSLVTDAVTVTNQPVDPAQPIPATTSDKSPLDILEDLLNDAKSLKEEGALPGADAAPDESQQLADIQHRADQQALADQAQAAQKVAVLQQLAASPEMQARNDQDQQKNADLAQEQANRDKYQIHQLGHTKI